MRLFIFTSIIFILFSSFSMAKPPSEKQVIKKSLSLFYFARTKVTNFKQLVQMLNFPAEQNKAWMKFISEKSLADKQIPAFVVDGSYMQFAGSRKFVTELGSSYVKVKGQKISYDFNPDVFFEKISKVLSKKTASSSWSFVPEAEAFIVPALIGGTIALAGAFAAIQVNACTKEEYQKNRAWCYWNSRKDDILAKFKGSPLADLTCDNEYGRPASLSFYSTNKRKKLNQAIFFYKNKKTTELAKVSHRQGTSIVCRVLFEAGKSKKIETQGLGKTACPYESGANQNTAIQNLAFTEAISCCQKTSLSKGYFGSYCHRKS